MLGGASERTGRQAANVYAPDSYGGFLSAPEAARRLRARFAARGVEVRVHPMSDGGEGLLDALAAHLPLRREGGVAWLDDQAVVEAAEAIGLKRAERPLLPLEASSAPLARLLRAARGGEILLGLGGTATVDGGLGLARALGLVDLDDDGPLTVPPARALGRETRLVGEPPELGRLRVLADVRTPLAGAIRRYGPQKGVTADQVEPLTRDLLHWADVLDDWRASRSRRGFGGTRGAIPRDLPGGGAAGGLGYLLATLFDATIESGAEVFAELTGLDGAIAGADVVILGEGRLDATSFEGKVAGVVIRQARMAGARVVALVGTATQVPPPPAGPDEIVEIGGERLDRFDRAVDRLADALRSAAS